MNIWIMGTEIRRAQCQYFQLRFSELGVMGLLLSNCSPVTWDAKWNLNGIEPATPLFRLAEHYKRLDPEAVIKESKSNFSISWEEVQEVRLSPNGPEIVLRLKTRNWFGRRHNRRFLVETPDGSDSPTDIAELEWYLEGRVSVQWV